MSAPLRLILFLAALLSAPLVRAQMPSAAEQPVQPSANLTSPVEAARVKIADAVKRMKDNDVEGSLADLTQAIQLKPDSAFAYLLRGSIYTQKKMFPEAQADFTAAEKFDPNNVVIKLNLRELKFMQKNFDDASVGFLPLEKDPDMGDFATYKVFLCDLLGGHEAVARSELDALNKKADDASYYFGNAAWDLYHKNIDDARSWLVSASDIFAAQKFTTYGASLRYYGYLPIPQANDSTAKP